MPTPVRRVVTGHDAQGKAIVIMDSDAPNQKVRQAGIVSTLLWVTDETPADISGDADRAAREIAVPPPPNGSILRVVDFPPESAGGGKLDNATILREMGITRASSTPARHAHMHRTTKISEVFPGIEADNLSAMPAIVALLLTNCVSIWFFTF